MTQPAPNPTPTPGEPAPALAPQPTAPAPQPQPPTPAEPAPADEPLGPAGKKALDEERAARKALEKQIAELAPLKRIADALGAGTPAAAGKSEVELLQERFAEYEKTVAEERQARWRAEVAAEKQLPPALAARLQGATRDEFAADADALKALIPAGPTSMTPAPDPSQGGRGGPPGADLDTRIAEAEKNGQWQQVIALKRQKAKNSK